MCEVGMKLGYHLVSYARAINSIDLLESEMIITMDENNYHSVKKMMQQRQSTKLYRMSDFSHRYDFLEVPDPYYGGVQGFRHVFALLEDACEGLLKQLQASLE